jgi:hypothetical protein
MTKALGGRVTRAAYLNGHRAAKRAVRDHGSGAGIGPESTIEPPTPMARPAGREHSPSMTTRRTWLLLVPALAVAASTAFSAFASSSQKLFFIQSSKNADEVHYDARVAADGSLEPKDTVDGYFNNKGADGKWTRADLTVFQKLAYGWDTEPSGNGNYLLKLRAFKDRSMWIVKVNGKWRVQTTVAGKQAYMNKLYVATDESGMMPKVLYVDIFGEDAATGGALTEHLVKN